MSAENGGLYVLGGELTQPLAPLDLTDVAARDADRRLADVLGRVDEQLATADETEVDGASYEALDTATVRRLEDLCTRPDAGVQLESLARRVRDGVLTWDQVWDSPHEHPGGVRLVVTVLAAG